jgi:hypothetical protein
MFLSAARMAFSRRVVHDRIVTPKENLLRALRHDDPGWVPNGLESVVMLWPPVVERPASPGLDAFGVAWSLEPGAEGGTYPSHTIPVVTDLSKWRVQIVFPRLDDLDWDRVGAEARAIDRHECLVSGFVEMGLFERSYLLLGMEDALIAYLEQPDAMEELVAALADYKIELIERFDDVADLDMVWYGDDWGTQTSLFLPPQTWRRILKPHTRRVYDCMRKRGILVNQHSCGKIDAVFDDILEMGADLLNPCQPCNDLPNMKRRARGRITFAGGLDSQFVLGRPGVTPDEVRAEVRTRIDEMAEGGGYVAAPSHSVPYDPAILDAMNDEIRRYGAAYYANTTRRSACDGSP